MKSSGEAGSVIGGVGRVPKYEAMDAWRGLAALWVLLLHAYVWRLPQDAPSIDSSPIRALIHRGQLGVTIFFVISGYCIASAACSSRGRPDAVRHYLRARVRRIYPPYYASMLFVLALTFLVAGLAGLGLVKPSPTMTLESLRQGPLSCFAALTLTQTPLRTEPLQIIYWTLNYEVAFYAVVAAFLVAMPRSWGPARLLYGLDLLTIACLAALLVRPEGIPFPFSRWPQFGLGILVFHVASSPGDRRPLALFAAACAMMLGFAAAYSIGGSPLHPSSRLEATFCVGVAVALAALRRWDGPSMRLAPVRWLARVGVFSYSLYLIHVPVVSSLARFLGRFAGTIPGEVALVLVQVAASLFVALIFFRYCERPFLSARKSKAVAAASSTPEVSSSVLVLEQV